MRVQVYWNLHKKQWSVVALEGERKGRVISHAAGAIFLEDVKFAVQPAGRDRVRREGRKNVHAFVRGEWVSNMAHVRTFRRWAPVVYDPYKFDTFVFVDNQEPVFSAKSVALLGPRDVVAEV